MLFSKKCVCYYCKFKGVAISNVYKIYSIKVLELNLAVFGRSVDYVCGSVKD